MKTENTTPPVNRPSHPILYIVITVIITLALVFVGLAIIGTHETSATRPQTANAVVTALATGDTGNTPTVQHANQTTLVVTQDGDAVDTNTSDMDDGYQASNSNSDNFSKYPVEIYSGARIVTPIGDFKDMRTQLKNLSKQKIDFAGQYVTGGWGCGTGCASTVLLNVQTGKAQYLEGLNTDVDCSNGLKAGIETKANSRLMIMTGAKLSGPDDGSPHACITQSYLEQDGQLNLIH